MLLQPKVVVVRDEEKVGKPSGRCKGVGRKRIVDDISKQGEKINFEIDDLFNDEGIITVVNPFGYVVSQKSFYKTLN